MYNFSNVESYHTTLGDVRKQCIPDVPMRYKVKHAPTYV